jgi:hypothetical protein
VPVALVNIIRCQQRQSASRGTSSGQKPTRSRELACVHDGIRWNVILDVKEMVKFVAMSKID